MIMGLIVLLVRILIKAWPYLLVIALVIWLAWTVVPSLENVLGGIELPDIPKVSESATKPQVGQTTGGAPGTYTVQKGDMLSKIAKEFDTSVAVLVELNKDRYPSLETNPGLIQHGWKLTVRSTSVSDSLPAPIPSATPQVVVTATENILGLKFHEIAPNAKVIAFSGPLGSEHETWANNFWYYVIFGGMEVGEAAYQAAEDAIIKEQLRVYGNTDFELNPRKEGIVDTYGDTRCAGFDTSEWPRKVADKLGEKGYTSRPNIDIDDLREKAIEQLRYDEIFFFHGHGKYDSIRFYKDEECNPCDLLPSDLPYEEGELENLRLVVLLACGDPPPRWPGLLGWIETTLKDGWRQGKRIWRFAERKTND
jgi:LysM repeat protein